MSVDPSPRRWKETLVAALARFSSSTRRLYSASSAISGAMTSRSPRLRRRSSSRPEVTGLADQVRLGLRAHLRVEGRREVVQRLHDHLRVRDVDRTRGPVMPLPPSTARPELPRGRQSANCTRVVAGGVGQPVRGRPGAGLDGNVVGDREDTHPLGLSTGDEPRQSDQKVLLFAGLFGSPGRSGQGRPARARGARAARRRCWTWINSSIDHRQSRAQNPLSTRDSGTCSSHLNASWVRPLHHRRRSRHRGTRRPRGRPHPRSVAGTPTS